MRFTPVILSAIAALSLQSAFAAPSFISGVTEDSGWYDVNKKTKYDFGTYYNPASYYDQPYDNSLCWAAAASNTLQWWQDKVVVPAGTPNGAASTVSDAPYAYQLQIYQTFTANWTNQGGRAEQAWNWWFNGGMLDQNIYYSPSTTSAVGGYLKEYGLTLTNTDGTPLFRTTNFYQEQDKAAVFSTLTSFIDENRGTVLSVVENGGHAITMWGYEYGSEGELYLYLTDSDDGVYSLFKQEVLVDDAKNVYLCAPEGEADVYTSAYSASIDGTVENFNGCMVNRITGLTDPTPYMIPEPSAALLSLMGLMVGMGVRRRK